jgi:hypothetical protein
MDGGQKRVTNSVVPEPAGSSLSLQETAIGPYPEPTGATLPGRRENISSLITGIEMAVRFMRIKLRKEYERGSIL